MAKYADIAVGGSVENIQNLVLQAFTSNGFTVQWDGALKGKADRGSMEPTYSSGQRPNTMLLPSKSTLLPKAGR